MQSMPKLTRTGVKVPEMALDKAYNDRLKAWVESVKLATGLRDRSLALAMNEKLRSKGINAEVTHRAIQGWRSGNLKRPLYPESVEAIAAYRNWTPEDVRTWLHEGREPKDNSKKSASDLTLEEKAIEVRSKLEEFLQELVGAQSAVKMSVTVSLPEIDNYLVNVSQVSKMAKRSGVISAIIREELIRAGRDIYQPGELALAIEQFVAVCPTGKNEIKEIIRGIALNENSLVPEQPPTLFYLIAEGLNVISDRGAYTAASLRRLQGEDTENPSQERGNGSLNGVG